MIETFLIRVIVRFAILVGLMLLSDFARAEQVTVLRIEGAIGPATADYIQRGIAKANADHAQLIVLTLDTPGGLDTAMRTIIKSILASPIPVASYVSPGGARAASAGTYILYASHIAAMAPGTNLGAATPVRIGGADEPERPTNGDRAQQSKRRADEAAGEPALTRKQINDAAAYIRGLAQMRGRNAEWAERAVREAVSLSAEEALPLRVIDTIASDVPQLLVQLDGKSFNTPSGVKTLHTSGGQIVHHDPDWRTRFLAVITDPSIALLLLTIGVFGLIVEFSAPGVGVGGVLGGISLLVALYALQLLPVNYAGLALVLLGLGCMIAEAFLPSFGVLGIGGVAAFITGGVILIDTDQPGFGIPASLIVSIAILSALLLSAVIGLMVKSRRLAVVTGAEQLIGETAEVIDVEPRQVWVRLRGELWKVESTTPLHKGQKVRVVDRNGLVLRVTPIDDTKQGAR